MLLAYPAPAQNPTAAPLASNVPPPDVRARMWAATARFVYGNDPDLATLRPQLLQTIDSSSVKGFGHSLDNAVRLEKRAAPKQGHMLKFQELFKLTSNKSTQLADLPTNIANALLENKPTRRTEPAFIQLRNQLHQLADPNAPVPAAAPVVTDTPAVTTPRPAVAPANAAATSTPTSTPMLTYLALALSVISLLVALFKGNSRGRHRHSAAAAPSLSSLTDEMRAEVRTMVQREVGKLPGARPAPDAPAQPKPAAAAPAAPKAAPTTPPVAKTAPAPPAPAPAPAPVAAEPAKPVAPEPTPAAATPAPADDFFTVNYPVDAAPAPAAGPTRTRYANQPPLNGEFQRNSLADAPASYTIFELTSTEASPDQAQFVVAGNSAGHAGYIGSHQNILGGACTYSYPKGGVSRIITEVPGTAQRTPGGDWQIMQKAQIRFE